MYQVPRGSNWAPANPLPTYDVDEVFGPEELKLRLHWYQWVVYSVVLITCVAVLYSLVEVYLFLSRLQEALQQLANSVTLGG